MWASYDISPSDMRRLIEMAFMHAWGKDGSCDLRQEFERIHGNVKGIGTFTYYSGNNTFTWTDAE